MILDKKSIKNSFFKIFLQLWRFGVTGGIAFVIDFFLLIVLTELLSINYLLSATLSFISAVIFNYILSVYWVYDVKQERKGSFLVTALFFSLALIGLCINNIILFIGVEYFNIHYTIIKSFSAFTVMIFNFTSRKFLLEF